MALDTTFARMETKLPEFKKWLEDTKRRYRGSAVSIAAKRIVSIQPFFPSRLLENTMAVVTADPFPAPPLSEMGFPELAYWKADELAGITYDNYIFIKPSAECDSLYFHEMVHVVQNDALGADTYLLAYGASIIADTYDRNPFELTAYRLQDDFEKNAITGDVIAEIENDAREIWTNLKNRA